MTGGDLEMGALTSYEVLQGITELIEMVGGLGVPDFPAALRAASFHW
jgi:hypothetical protein